jgi:Tol biopolymer transport system component
VDPGTATEVSHAADVPRPVDPRERVVFTRAGSIWMSKPDGSDASQLTVRALDAPDEDPTLAPGGDAIAYSARGRKVNRIVILPLAELVAEPLTDGGGTAGDSQPAWSPDGRRVAFMRGDPRVRLDLYVVEVPARAGVLPLPSLLVRGDDDVPERVGGPAFSPDGAAIVFSADRRQGKGTGIWRRDLATSSLERVSPVPRHAAHVADLDPTFSPDGSRIAFVSNRHVPSADRDDLDVYAIASDGSGLTRLTDDPGSVREPSYSPDGQRIFFASTRDRRGAYEWELYVMASSGGRARRLTHDERPQNRAPSAGLAK